MLALKITILQFKMWSWYGKNALRRIDLKLRSVRELEFREVNAEEPLVKFKE